MVKTIVGTVGTVATIPIGIVLDNVGLTFINIGWHIALTMIVQIGFIFLMMFGTHVIDKEINR